MTDDLIVPDVVFVDAFPESTAWKGPHVDWQSVAERLSARPGKWAKIVVAGKVWTQNEANMVRAYAPFRPKGLYEAGAQSGELYMRKVTRAK